MPPAYLAKDHAEFVQGQFAVFLSGRAGWFLFVRGGREDRLNADFAVDGRAQFYAGCCARFESPFRCHRLSGAHTVVADQGQGRGAAQ